MMLRQRNLWIVAAVLIVAQLALRASLAVRGDFYWDDLILIAEASSRPILSWDYLTFRHDGQLMPGTMLLAGVTTVAAPLQWLPAALTLVVLQAIASCAVWRMIRIAAPAAGTGALVALACYLFCALSLPVFAWWSAGLASLPMQAALAYVIGNAILLTRGEIGPVRRRWLVAGAVAAFVVAVLFSPKSLVIGPVAVIAAVLAGRGEPTARGRHARPEPGASAGAGPGLWRVVRGVPELWAGLGAVTVIWAALYLPGSGLFSGHAFGQAVTQTWRSIHQGLIPALAGGPWTWERWVPAPPTADAGIAVTVFGWLIAVGVVAWAVLARRGGLAIAGLAAGYTVIVQFCAMWLRSGAAEPLELGRTLHALSDTAVVFALAVALLAATPESRRVPAVLRERGAAGLVPTLGVPLLVISALVTAGSFSSVWRDNPTGPYLTQAKRSLSGHPDLVMFDQPVPLEVLGPVAYPNNQISRVFGRVENRPRFGSVTDDLRVLDVDGALVPGAVTPVRTVQPGADACDAPSTQARRTLNLDGPLVSWKWTVALTYCATGDGEVEFRLAGGRPVTVPVRGGLGVVYFQLSGEGGELFATLLTPDLGLHTGEVRIGEPAVAAAIN